MTTVALTVCVAGLVVSQSEATVGRYMERGFRYTGGEYDDETFSYRLMAPESMEEGAKYPLVLFLHGAGERGDDNQAQLLYFPELMASESHRERFRCFVLAPQCRRNKWWARFRRRESDDSESGDPRTDQMCVVEGILEEVLEEFPIDRQRVYLTGLSMGGYGSWDLGTRHPEWFAAVAPICGGGDSSSARRLVGVPVWAAHGAEDRVVPAERTREMIDALREAGGEPVYREYEGVGHNSWTPAYEEEDGLIAWMFQQRKADAEQ